MEVHGRDIALEAYRVSVADGPRRLVGLVPEYLIARGLAGARLPHHTAYDWLARHAEAIEAALRAKQAGRPVRGPLADVQLAEETRHAD